MKVEVNKELKDIIFPVLMYNEYNDTLILATGYWEHKKHNFKGVCLRNKNTDLIGSDDKYWNAVAFKPYKSTITLSND